MRRKMIAALVVSSAIAGAASRLSAAEQTPHTTRIDPNQTYGASVTIEEGVRVFRPLPSEDHVIVNPGGQTPIGLGAIPLVGASGTSQATGHR